MTLFAEGTCNVYQVDKTKKQVLVNQMNVGTGAMTLIESLSYLNLCESIRVL